MRAPRRTGAAALVAAGLGLGSAVGGSAGPAAGAGPVRTEALAARAGYAGHARATGIASSYGTQAVTSLARRGSDSAVATGRGPVEGFADATVSLQARVARARVQVTSVSIFGGLVTARRVTASATARTGRSPTFTGSVAGLTAAGQALPSGPGSHSAGGYGTVTVLRDGQGLVITLTHPYGGHPAGEHVVIAAVAARAPRPPVAPKPARPSPTRTTTTHTATTTSTQAAPAPKPSPAPAPAPAHRPRSHQGAAGHHAKHVPRRRAPKIHAGLTGSGYAFPVYSAEAEAADNFGAPREIGAHQGDDIFAPFGTPVVAVHDGRIGQVGTLPISGNRLWLHTSSGAAFFYCHLSAFAPAAVDGARVKAGTVLGFVGNTGDAEPTPPHLHFEIHPHGQEDTGAIDPYPILRAWQHRQDVPRGSWLTDTAERPGTLVQVRDFLAER